jgi:hypothetical protein
MAPGGGFVVGDFFFPPTIACDASARVIRRGLTSRIEIWCAARVLHSRERRSNANHRDCWWAAHLGAPR